jgi:hypothetical protein
MALSLHCRQPGDGRAGGATTPISDHPSRILHAVGVDIGLQQRERHEVELGATAADTFEFVDDRFEPLMAAAKSRCSKAAKARDDAGTDGPDG